VDRQANAHHSADLPCFFLRRVVDASMSAPESVKPDAFGFAPPYAVDEPAAHTLPFVFNTGHSGAVYPPHFIAASRLDALALRRSEDAYVERLFAPVVELGAPLLRANFPRAFLDVNREPFELDPRMFDGRLPPFANTRSMRVAGGLGTVPRVVADGQEIYARRLPVEEATALQAVSPDAAELDPANGQASRALRADRLPFDAVVESGTRRGDQG
jgi:N-formylglutamate amidohydrolase